MMKKGMVSILLVNWNQADYIDDCLKSIFSSKYKNHEVIVVDNASTDGSQKVFQKAAKKKKIIYIESKANLGFTEGNNLALKKAQGEYVLLLNVDTKFTKDMIGALVKFLLDHKKAAVVQPKLVFMDDNSKLDNVGAYLTKTGIPYYFGLYKDARKPTYNRDLKVYTCKGACMLVRHGVIKKIGFLDDYMFAYYEESDFCHRVWLAGYTCWYTSSVQVEHYVGSTYKSRDNLTTLYKSHRNRIRSFLKNFEVTTLVWLLPVHALSLLGVSFVETLRGDYKRGFAILRAMLINITILPDTLHERKIIQTKIRKVSDRAIEKYIFKNPRLSYYRYVGGGLENYID